MSQEVMAGELPRHQLPALRPAPCPAPCALRQECSSQPLCSSEMFLLLGARTVPVTCRDVNVAWDLSYTWGTWWHTASMSTRSLFRSGKARAKGTPPDAGVHVCVPYVTGMISTCNTYWT